MEVHFKEEAFREIGEKVKSELEEAVKERKAIGLESTNAEVHIGYYNSQHTDATAKFISGKGVIDINVLPITLNSLDGRDLRDVKDVILYFDLIRDFYGNQHEDSILATIKNPGITLRNFEKSLIKQGVLERYKDSLKKNGRTFESYRKIAFNNAKRMREILERTMSTVRKIILNGEIPHLRHELDHVDFFGSPLSQEFYRINSQSRELKRILELQGDKSVSMEYAGVNMELLESKAEVLPLTEIRALFFSHIKPGEWKNADFDEIKRRVYGTFVGKYIEDVSENILDKIVSWYWSERKMDRETSNYLFHMVNFQRDSPNVHKYNVHPEKVNFDVANTILYEEMPFWKQRFAENGKIAVDAIGRAFKEEPGRLNRAKKAKSFDEFIEICKNKPVFL